MQRKAHKPLVSAKLDHHARGVQQKLRNLPAVPEQQIGEQDHILPFRIGNVE